MKRGIVGLALACLLACGAAKSAKEADVVREDAVQIAGFVPGMSWEAAYARLTAVGIEGQKGDARHESIGERVVAQRAIRFSGDLPPLGPVADGFLLFANGRLVRMQLVGIGGALGAVLSEQFGPAHLAVEGSSFWDLRAVRTLVSCREMGDGARVEARFFGVAIEEGELSEAYYAEQMRDFDEALQQAREGAE
jgi:hypothetical protein